MTDRSLRHLLRTATSPAHQRLDDVISHDLDFGTASYTALLLGLARGLIPIENALEVAGVSCIFPDWPERRRSDALRADLADLGETLPAISDTFSVTGTAQALGALYVLEGSRLGSQVLLKRAFASDSAAVHRATRHLTHGQGKKFWPSFVEVLDHSIDAQVAPNEVIEGANRAFAFIHEAFTLPGLVRPDHNARAAAR